jgi:hypothetical protein
MPNQNEQTSRTEKDSNQAAELEKDDPRQAIESGEPRIAGHQGTRIIDDEEGTDKPNRDDQRRNSGEKQNWESEL